MMTSFEDGTLPLYNHIMMPTNKYNRKTLLALQNLRNNYLYSANTGILFTNSLKIDPSLKLENLRVSGGNKTNESLADHGITQPRVQDFTGEPVNI